MILHNLPEIKAIEPETKFELAKKNGLLQLTVSALKGKNLQNSLTQALEMVHIPKKLKSV